MPGQDIQYEGYTNVIQSENKHFIRLVSRPLMPWSIPGVMCCLQSICRQQRTIFPLDGSFPYIRVQVSINQILFSFIFIYFVFVRAIPAQIFSAICKTVALNTHCSVTEFRLVLNNLWENTLNGITVDTQICKTGDVFYEALTRFFFFLFNFCYKNSFSYINHSSVTTELEFVLGFVFLDSFWSSGEFSDTIFITQNNPLYTHSLVLDTHIVFEYILDLKSNKHTSTPCSSTLRFKIW